MYSVPELLRVVAAAYAADVDTWTTGNVVVERVPGGANNALYRITAGALDYACKLCVADGRRRAAREYATLHLLRVSGLDIAPEPLHLDESCAVVPFPVVLYRWLPGKPSDGRPTAAQLAALLDTFQAIHSLGKEGSDFDLAPACFHWFDPQPYVDELHCFLEEYSSWLVGHAPNGDQLCRRLSDLVDDCAEVLLGTKVGLSAADVPLCLCRVDPNLNNVICGEDGRLRWVDWEYSGWGDPALDLAELRWHAALAGLDHRQQAWLRENYRRSAGDPAFEQRLALWDVLLSTRWPFLILRWWWSLYNGPDRLRLSQPSVDSAELHARLLRFIERAENLT